jgi:UDP-N-acetylglucosamine--N-acetylmuramyl-(pentapeptide) pyrophosphoryl-undecaprenol N-acetylglucosamine transferase
MQQRRIILVGGQTTGHILPMMAVGQAYRRAAYLRDVVVFGDPDGPEAGIVPGYGFEFRAIAGAPIRGVHGAGRRISAYWATAKAFVAARTMLAESPVALVAGFGGYVTAAPLLAARSLGIPTAIYEPNAIPGLTNRRLRALADLRLVGLHETTTRPGWSDAIVAGHPIRAEVLDVRSREREPGALRLLVTAGLRGSAFLNAAAPELCAALRSRGVSVTAHHQAGDEPTDEIARAYARRGVSARVEPFIADMPAAFEGCDAVVCAGGAGTLSEIAALHLPALVVPIAGTADDHQAANARAFSAHLCAVCMTEGTWDAVRAAEALAALAAVPVPSAPPPRNAAATFVAHCERLIARCHAPARTLPAGDPIEYASS